MNTIKMLLQKLLLQRGWTLSYSEVGLGERWQAAVGILI